MDRHLSPETEAALRDLAREIGDARGIDEDAREELFGHLEDKTISYLSGEEGLSEADAVVLTRAHFGGSVKVEEVAPQTSENPQRLTLLHRLLMVAGVTVVFGNILQRAATSLIWTIVDFDPPLFLKYPIVILVLSVGTSWSLAIVAALILRRWERYIRAGTAFRFDPYRKYLSAAVGIIVVMIFSFVISALPSPPLRSSAVFAYWTSTVAWPMLWIWWFDHRAGRMENFAFGALAWVGFRFALGLLPSITSGTISLTDSTFESTTSHYLQTLFVQAGAPFVLYFVYAAWRDGVRVRTGKTSPEIQ